MALGRALLPRIIIVPDYLVPEGSEILPAPSLETWGGPVLVLWGPPGLDHKYFISIFASMFIREIGLQFSSC